MTRFLIITLVQLSLFVLVYGTQNSRLKLDTKNPAFDPGFYENLLDPEICQQQLSYLRNVSNILLRYEFLDAGLRFPKGLLNGNFVEMGNYYDCLGISEEIEDSTIEGKYCIVQPRIDFESLGTFADAMDWKEFDSEIYSNEEMVQRYRKYEEIKTKVQITINEGALRTDVLQPIASSLRLATCIPKACSVKEGIEGLNLINATVLGLEFDEEFCRVNNDKPWVPADYVAITVFSIIGILTLISTGYDVWHTFIAKKDPKSASVLYRSFSMYTNGKRLTTFSSNPNNLDCVDGIRMISMLWIIVGHTYVTTGPLLNTLYAYTVYLFELKSLWISSANFAVDTFFTLTGILTVYTTVGKLDSMRLLKSLHLFYLNRILRLFPLLAAIILLQASVFHRVSDGPLWTDNVAINTDHCRTYWWTTLLYVQNFVNAESQCINHGWYLAIDMHMHLISPLVLFWVLSGKPKRAWMGLTGGLLVILTGTAVYCFINQFPGWTIAPDRGEKGTLEYFYDYYFNSLARAPPFFVGMVFGYLLCIWRGQKVKIHPGIVALLWLLTVLLTSMLMYTTHMMKDFDTWRYPVVDDLMNTFGRALWAMAVGWVVFACKNGMGGPLNWFLSLHVWKLPSRISFAIYLFSYPIQFIVAGSAVEPLYFNDGFMMYEFFAQVAITLVVAFFATLLIDSPFSVLFKMLLGGGPKRPKKADSKIDSKL